MAVGYHKLNSSAARSKRSRTASEGAKFDVVGCGQNVWSPAYGFGVTECAFVASCDKVSCRFESGYQVEFSGGAVRRMMIDYSIQVEKR